jgi:hypothetical protein
MNRNPTAHIPPPLLLALALTLAYHGALLFHTFRRTYDAYVHIFFADHYARAWFDHWETRWYTGFTMTSYPPGSQQSIALLSPLVGLETGFIIVQVCAMLLVVVGIYRFARIWVSEEAAGYAALLAVFSSSLTETMHVFGQLPTTFSLGFLLNALPYVYRWLHTGDWRVLLVAWAVNAATTAGHHVTTLFGAVFFVGPVIVLALVEQIRTPLPDEPQQHPPRLTRRNLGPLVVRRLRRVLPGTMRAGVYGVGLIIILVLVVLPYWLWSKSDPITQVSIPHASRDSFILNPNAGLVFWVIPYGVALVALPYVLSRGLLSRAWPLMLSFALLFFLGTGGTTPLPRMLLRGAYDILTLDRFTFWATIVMLPLLGAFVVSLRRGRLARYLREQFGRPTWRGVQMGLLVAYLLFSVFTANLTLFRRFQPAPIDMQPIVAFLEKDEHWRWRYLALGFGDQMAWLSAQTSATTVDGNYHSARRLPELTTTPVERLEGAKFRGMPGIGSLQQFLAVPERYHLKFVFSNDQFYDPLLAFSGWHRLQRLENGIVVWERADIPPLPEVLPRKEIPVYQRVMWGIVPLSALLLASIAVGALAWHDHRQQSATRPRLPPLLAAWWRRLDSRLRRWSRLPTGDNDAPGIDWRIWRAWIERLPRPRPAPPSARLVRSTLLLGIVLGAAALGAAGYLRQSRDPVAVVEAYYDDLDFRRFAAAHARLDPLSRPTFDQYMLEQSMQGGLVASYGKLDAIEVRLLSREPGRVVAQANTRMVTALQTYQTSQQHTLVQRDGQWYILPDPADVTIPPDQFFRRGTVAWGAQGRRRPTDDTTAFADVLDRPTLAVHSARLVRSYGRYAVVGELTNTDTFPGDVTVTAILFGAQGEELTRYNAQTVIMHKLLPQETTPFRIEFEGVAGQAITDAPTSTEFEPGSFTPLVLEQPVASFAVYARAVVTGRDLYHDVAAQHLEVTYRSGQLFLQGELLNNGTGEATIPQLLLTYYDEQGQVAWVEEHFIESAIRPQRAAPFRVPLMPPGSVETMIEQGARYPEGAAAPDSRTLLPLPPGSGYAALRVSVNYYAAGEL